MLDLYLIHDTQNMSSKGLALERVGGIKDELFFQLQQEGIIEPWFDYYSKFRWQSELVKRMVIKLQKRFSVAPLPKGYELFVSVLNKAARSNSGLLAIED
ncbi:hypothetical protein [Hymenobacter fodinae]|uniref:Uncharacterized protein n=1 Tax=Hymenobacter fodinae TaxID=2510796 RepID=A0A4Z0P193_9BACT|nr:hypothetical protein [Hymenobacter fodinae]TGE04926.1 hypothetical protein EU556_22405 [Hymenobacter fodinae]